MTRSKSPIAQTGNAAWFGVVWEHGVPAYYAMRLHVSRGRIDEIETVVHRKTGLPAPFGPIDKVGARSRVPASAAARRAKVA